MRFAGGRACARRRRADPAQSSVTPPRARAIPHQTDKPNKQRDTIRHVLPRARRKIYCERDWFVASPRHTFVRLCFSFTNTFKRNQLGLGGVGTHGSVGLDSIQIAAAKKAEETRRDATMGAGRSPPAAAGLRRARTHTRTIQQTPRRCTAPRPASRPTRSSRCERGPVNGAFSCARRRASGSRAQSGPPGRS